MSEVISTRQCRRCRYSTTAHHGTQIHCAWEKHTLPPPVFRARIWGKDAPRTEDFYAEHCQHYEAAP